MAKGGGGSWKVAYADFVTAMMAFFLVMWIGAQDEKTRRSVANYFVDPSGVDKKPVRSGSVNPSPNPGPIPQGQEVGSRGGREPLTQAGEFGPATKLVSDWIRADPKRLREWKDKARVCREAAAASPAVRDHSAVASEVATKDLAVRLSATFTTGNPARPNDVYQELMYEALRHVNWDELAEDLLKE